MGLNKIVEVNMISQFKNTAVITVRCRMQARRNGFLDHRARQLYNNISILFLFPVKDGKLSTGVNATFNASCYG